MRQHTVVEYEQSDFDAVRNGMTQKEAAEILDSLPRGWFPYDLPSWSKNVTASDFDNFRICCALDIAIKALEEAQKNDRP